MWTLFYNIKTGCILPTSDLPEAETERERDALNTISRTQEWTIITLTDSQRDHFLRDGIIWQG